MNKPELSIIMPAIRRNAWDSVYESILLSTTKSFELIIVSPYPLTEKLQSLRNVKYVKDFGSLMRAANIGATLCEGKFVTWSADDCLFLPEALDNNINELIEMGDNYKNVIVTKYFEGTSGSYKPLQNDEYYIINKSPTTKSPFLLDSWWIFNATILYRTFLEELGAWDCEFQAGAMGYIDMAVRAQFDGAIVKLTNHPLYNCGHMPGPSGDHAPIHFAQLLEDEPRFRYKYSKEIDPNKIKINMANWKNAETVWSKRFI